MASGKAKVKATIELISEKHQSLIKGESVTIESYELEKLGLSPVEKIQALEVLADDYKCIRFIPKPKYDSEDDIDPRTRVDIIEASSFSALSEQQILDEVLAEQVYTVEVFPNLQQVHDNILSDELSENFAPVNYDDEHAKATYKGQSQKLFDANTIKSILAAQVFRADGARMRATDIIFAIENARVAPDTDLQTRTLINAKDGINRDFNAKFGIDDVICYERQEFWLNEKYCSLKSPYRSALSSDK